MPVVIYALHNRRSANKITMSVVGQLIPAHAYHQSENLSLVLDR
jgi:hypothetical protein